jgi:hypothetical protein
MEAGFDKNNQFQHSIIDPGDIKSKQQQPGLLYVATSHAKTIGEITPDMKHPKTSAIYWTGSGMSINRVINGSTKKQQNTQSHEKINCLKIDKRQQLVKYSTKQNNITIAGATTRAD